MNKYKTLAIVFTLLSLGAVEETGRIITSNDADIASSRADLIPMAAIITGVIVITTLVFWYKAADKN